MLVRSILACLLVAIALPTSTDGANILGIFHFPSKSHHILGNALMKALVKRGHQVTMISPFPEKNTSNYTHIELTGLLDYKEDRLKLWVNYTIFEQLYQSFTFIPEISRQVIGHENFKKLLESNQKFDVVIQFWAFAEPLLGFADKLGAPVIAFSPIGASVFVNYYVGNPSPFSYVPNPILGYSDRMTFLERVANTVTNIFFDIFHAVILTPFEERLYQQHFPNGRPLQELIDEVNLYLINSHHSTETSRPYLPNMIQIGGYHLQEDQELSEDLRKYLDESKEGVIYVSFGTNVKSTILSDQQKDAIIKILGKQNMKVLWKVDEELPNMPSNIRVEKWLPQKSILAHPNTKLFLSHGGMGGISEAIYNGVPIIGIPFFGDQDANVVGAVSKGYAIRVHPNELTEETLSAAVNEILTNTSYREEIQYRSSLYKERPVNPEDLAVFWVEHVIKHKGAKHLRPVASDLPFYQYYLLDVIAFLVSILGVVLATFYIITKKIIKCICKKINSKKSGAKKPKAKTVKKVQ